MINTREHTINEIQRCGIIAIVRSQIQIDLVATIQAIAAGGASVVEVTTNTEGWEDAIRKIASTTEITIGAGTVTNEASAKTAIDAGAKYLVTPNTSPAIIDIANEQNIPVVMGALTPTEAHTAYNAGADFIKLFPADQFGPSYLKAIKATMHDAKFIPTGGINLNNCHQWFNVGISAVGVGSSIVDNVAAEKGDFEKLTHLAAAFVSIVSSVRK